MNSELLGDIRDVASLTDAQIAAILKRAPSITKFLAEVKEAAEARALAGNPVEGTKLVKGRSSRSWKKGAETQIFSILEATLDGDEAVADLIYEPQKLKTVAALEKDIGAKTFKVLEELVETSEGKPALVDVDDPRPEWKPEKKNLFPDDWE